LEENGQIVHSLRTAVIDPEGKLAVLYRGNEWRPADAAEKLKQLIGSSGRAKASHQPKSSN
jgi:protein SCO1/2